MFQIARHASLVSFLLVYQSLASSLSLVDPSFAVGSGTDNSVEAFYLQADGRILIGGDFGTINGQDHPFLARLNNDGSVDGSFNPQGATDANVYRIQGLPDGKVLVAGGFKTLLDASRQSLARLQADGTVDPAFDPGNAIGGTVFSLAVQSDGRIWLGVSTQPGSSQILRLQTNGLPDSTYSSTNNFDGYIFALLPLTNGGVLAGVNPQSDPTKPALVSLLPDGRLDTNFDAGLTNSSVFALAQEPDGHVLVGGLLSRSGQPGSAPLLRMTADLRWDNTFQPDTFVGGSLAPAVIDTFLVQPDGKIVAGGYFFEVGGYCRREVVRLSSDGHVDPCFDPGLGLGTPTPAGPVRALLLQPDGRILLGGFFGGVDEVTQQHNIARLLSQNACNSIRVYLGNTVGTPPGLFTAATFPPGGTNILETSSNLQDWHELARDTAPYLYVSPASTNQNIPTQFFRARQQF